MDRDTDDSKIASRKIKIGAEIGIPGLVKAHVEYINSKIDNTCAATNTGYRSAASVTGRDSVAIATGRNSKVLGSIGCWLVAAEYGAFDGEDYPLLCVRTAQVDGVEIKPDTWYTLKDGVFTEADNL